MMTMHHIVSDGWSVGILVNEISALYAAFRDGKSDPLPELSIQYADYAMWQRGKLVGGELERQSTYWKEVLEGAPTVLELPSDRARPSRRDYAGDRVPIELGAELSGRLRELGRA